MFSELLSALQGSGLASISIIRSSDTISRMFVGLGMTEGYILKTHVRLSEIQVGGALRDWQVRDISQWEYIGTHVFF